jgi:hypothetical protein
MDSGAACDGSTEGAEYLALFVHRQSRATETQVAILIKLSLEFT